MKKKTKRVSSSNSSWRQIHQSANRKVVTAHAKRRIRRGVVRAFASGAFLAAIGVSIFFGIRYWPDGVEKVNTMLPPQPLREIVFETDGVIPKQWVENLFDFPEDVDLMTIDIHEKKALLESFGQIESATLRRLSGLLEIRLRERRPVVRLAVRDAEGKVAPMLVDRNGIVYSGIFYDRYELSTLPFLAGVELRQEGNGFRRLRGIDQVDELLRAAHNYSPQLQETWRVVDCSDLPLIKIRSDEIREIVFGPSRYQQQLQWLDMIIQNNRRQLLKLEERVDLSLGNQVVVR